MTDKIKLTLEDLGVLMQTAERNGTTHAWLAVAMEWCGNANAEIERLQAELANVNNEFGSQTADWPDAWKRVADLKQLSNDRWRETERLRAALDRIAEYPRQRNDELSIEGARALARAALKEKP